MRLSPPPSLLLLVRLPLFRLAQNVYPAGKAGERCFAWFVLTFERGQGEQWSGVEWSEGAPGWREAGQRVVHFGVNTVQDEPQDERMMRVLADFMWVMACRQSWPASCVWLTPWLQSPPSCSSSITIHLPLSRCLHLATPFLRCLPPCTEYATKLTENWICTFYCTLSKRLRLGQQGEGLNRGWGQEL